MIDSKIAFYHQCPNDPPFVKISIDSRIIEKDDLFVALIGAQFDGLHFAQEALKRGACGIVFSANEKSMDQINLLKEKYRDRHFIKVDDTYKYLKEVARIHLSQWKKSGGKVIAITGSNGKTTTKEMLTDMLKPLMSGQVLSTQGNLNNQIGVPLTIFKLLPKHKWAIIEMGTNQKGEIKILCDFVQPDMGIITNISGTHLEYLENEEGVFQEKRALFDAVMENSNNNGVFITNADNQYLKTLPQNKNVISFGEHFGIQKIKLDQNQNQIQIGKVLIKNKFVTGRHNLTNLACSFLMAREVLPDRIDELVERANRFQPRPNRSFWFKRESTDIFLDAYNANPASMEAAMAGFIAAINQKNIALERVLWIVGDMNELGEQAAHFHSQLGASFKEIGASYVIFVGHYYDHFQQGFAGSRGQIQHLSNIRDFDRILGKKYLHSFKAVFIKGSRSLQLESLVDIN